MSSPEELVQIAHSAKSDAEKALNKIEGHEELCAERYGNINTSIADLKKLNQWIISLFVGIMLSMLAWSLSDKAQTLSKRDDVLLREIQELRRATPIPADKQPE